MSREVYLRSTIYLKFILFQVFFNRSSIPDPSFLVNLKFLLLKIFLKLSLVINAFKVFQATEFDDRPVPEKLDMGFLLTWKWHIVLHCRVRYIQVQSYPYKHIRDTYLTSDELLSRFQ